MGVPFFLLINILFGYGRNNGIMYGNWKIFNTTMYTKADTGKVTERRMTVSEKRWKAVKIILLLGSFLAAAKLIFVDYTLDEEYQIVMAYRTLQGDLLFREM